jgi:glutathione S-transferase
MILHDYDLSANCYAVRLLAAFLKAPIELRRVDVYPGHETERAPFLRLNPLGATPVLQADGLTLCDWQAILAHLAHAHDPNDLWWPPGDARLIEWLGFARALEASAGLARLHEGMGYRADLALCQRQAHQLLRVLERHLWFAEQAGRAWLLPHDHPTAADVAVFVHVIVCEEGGIERMDYPAVRRWTDRFRYLDGFVVMSGVFQPLLTAETAAA